MNEEQKLIKEVKQLQRESKPILEEARKLGFLQDWTIKHIKEV